MLSSGVNVNPVISEVVKASPSERIVPSAFFRRPEEGTDVMEIVNESPLESVGADKFKEASMVSILMLVLISLPA